MVLVVGSLVLLKGVSGDTDAQRLAQVHDHAGRLLASGFLRAIGFGLLGVPIIFLFQAARARSERVASRLFWLMVVAPLFLAVSTLVNTLAFDHIASQFVAMRGQSKDVEKLADDLARNSTLIQLASGLGLAGTFGVAAGLFYSSMWGMRTGLVTRFLGTFGMAVAVVFILIPFGVLIWCLAFGLLLVGLMPGGLPPAWAAGVAVPWPKPGEEPEPAAEPPGVVEGRASELPPGADESTDPGTESDQPSHPRSKKKRKRRA